MTKFDLVSPVNILTFFPGVCQECKSRITTVLMRRQDNERWFARLKEVKSLRANWPGNSQERLFLHEHPGFRRTGLLDQYVYEAKT